VLHSPRHLLALDENERTGQAFLRLTSSSLMLVSTFFEVLTVNNAMMCFLS